MLDRNLLAGAGWMPWAVGTLACVAGATAGWHFQHFPGASLGLIAGASCLGLAIWRAKLMAKRIREASHSLARDLGLPPTAVGRILSRVVEETSKLSSRHLGDVDPYLIIKGAAQELAQYQSTSLAITEQNLVRLVSQLPQRDFDILCSFKLGMKHTEIANVMGLDIDEVRGSLVRTYSDLRMRLGAQAEDGNNQISAERRLVN